ncbi:MAG TPA: hypothetical protein VK733_14535 [Gemmatimonadaceae bacterium]|jgi:hypothetical protein|nr:hypothetical protein [Gemmatimonadaceae bacterium]
MRVTPLTDRASLSDDTRATIAAIVAGHRTLSDVLRWGRVSEIVTQDEYTHDVVVPYDDRLTLVFDTT